MKYKMTDLSEEITIHKIISIHYFEYMSDFSFAGESHNFWEFLCVDKGEVRVVADHEPIDLQRGDVIFHKPNEFHNVKANGVTAPNLVVIGFECQSPAMKFFEDQILTLGEEEQELLAVIISEAKQCFNGRLDDPYQEELVRSPNAPFGAEQMIKIHLEQFLIRMFRKTQVTRSRIAKNPLKDTTPAEESYRLIKSYFDKNICDQLTISQICKDNLISSSQLKKLFWEMEGSGVIESFNNMKVLTAKQLMRNHQMNFTQIANYLGYTSVHYFSRQFKHLTGMTPSEYVTSIKRISEKAYDREG